MAQSSTEAKYRCIAHTTTELYWLCSLMIELHIPLDKAPVIHCDNVSAISLSLNPIFHARTKHIEVDYHFVREKNARKQIVLRFVSTKDQAADIFTKGLHPVRVKFLQSKLHLLDSRFSLREADDRYIDNG